MNRFWDSVIDPLLKIARPTVILEIGCDTGTNTRNLLEYCRLHGGHLHAVDPAPKFDPGELRDEYGDVFSFHRELSLEALPTLEAFDVVLTDGDHNWFTVYNELKLIGKQSADAGRDFPIVLNHDVGWPYGRRDLYYDPRNIPEAFRHPNRRAGISPDSSGLVETGCLNAHLHNACHSGGPRNGVLTGIEDFMAGCAVPLELAVIHGLHDLSILVPAETREGNPQLHRFLLQLEASTAMSRHVERMERSRIDSEIARQSQRVQGEELQGELVRVQRALKEQEDRAALFLRRITARDERLAGLEEQFKKLADSMDQMVGALRHEAREHTEQKAELKHELNALARKLSHQKEESAEHTAALNHELDALASKLSDQNEENAEHTAALNHELDALASKLSTQKAENAGLRAEEHTLREQRGADQGDLMMLSRWILELEQSTSEVIDSTRWKVGSLLAELTRTSRSLRFLRTRGRFLHRFARRPRRLLLGAPVPPALAHLDRVFESFYSWRAQGSARLRPPPSRSPAPVDSLSVDVIVCVHNALDDVRRCLDSVVRHSAEAMQLIIVNDGSDERTSRYLSDFTARNDRARLIQSEGATGYTKAANRGLRASSSDYAVLLNSDTLVGPQWIEGLIECGESDARIGIVGPLSNAASWQSVPKRFDSERGWAINPLPPGFDADDMAELISRMSATSFPRVPLLNGFCFAIKRKVIDAIGYLDEESFPNGYGEENDYCFRADDAGFELAVADHVYVHHAKSRSYGAEQRKRLAREGSRALARTHGVERIERATHIMRHDSALGESRKRVAAALASRGEVGPAPTRVIFLLPVRGGGGGAHSVIQEACGMRDLGEVAQVAVPAKHRARYLSAYAGVDPDIFHFYRSESELLAEAGSFDVAVATIFTSIPLLAQICREAPGVLPAYYIQDYEPWICEDGSALSREASASYTHIPGALCFAKTRWLCDIVATRHGVAVQKVQPSLDRAVYWGSAERVDGPVRIAAMVRPKTPRRSPRSTMQVLRQIQRSFPDRVSITTFGCEPGEAGFLELPRDFDFDHRGVLVQDEVAELLRETHIFVDLSTYQAFGRTGLEAMASGCATVLPSRGGTDEYAVDGENSLLVDTESMEAMIEGIEKLVRNADLRNRLSESALGTASRYSVEGAATSEIAIFREALTQRRAQRAAIREK